MGAYPQKASVRMLEVHDGGPVVRLVLLETTSRAGRDFREIERGVHREVEPETVDYVSMQEGSGHDLLTRSGKGG